MVKQVPGSFNYFLFVLLFVFNAFTINALENRGEFKSPFNDKYLLSPNTKSYTFFAGGHLYGYPSSSLFAAPSLISALADINKCSPAFFVSLGDNFRVSDSIQIEVFKKHFAEKLNCPMFNAVGNHDVSDSATYRKLIGDTWYSFRFANDYFIFLDSETDDGLIIGEQLEFLKQIAEDVSTGKTARNVFVFCHRLIWTVGDSSLRIVYDNTNAVGGYAQNDNFSKIVLPLLEKMAVNKKVFFLSGDIGVALKDKRWGFPLFYSKTNDSGITYLANGIGDNEKDVILKIDVDEYGNVSIQPFPLTPYKWNTIESYGLDFWNSYFKNKPHFSFDDNISTNVVNKLSFLGRIKNLISNLHFISGIAGGALLVLIISFFYRKVVKS